jgi:hypothetical protein
LGEGRASEDALHDPVEGGVEDAEVGGHDADEDDGDRGGLDQRVAIRPLDALELGPAGGDETADPAALALDLRLPRRPALLGFLGLPPALALGGAARAAADLVGRLGRRRGLGRRLGGGTDIRARWRRRLGWTAQPLEVGAVFGELRLEDVRGLGDLRVVLGAGLRVELGRGAGIGADDDAARPCAVLGSWPRLPD